MGDIIDLFVGYKQLEAKIDFIHEALVKKGIIKADKPKEKAEEEPEEMTPEEEFDMPQEEDDEPEDAEITLDKKKFEQKKKRKW